MQCNLIAAIACNLLPKKTWYLLCIISDRGYDGIPCKWNEMCRKYFLILHISYISENPKLSSDVTWQQALFQLTVWVIEQTAFWQSCVRWKESGNPPTENIMILPLLCTTNLLQIHSVATQLLHTTIIPSVRSQNNLSKPILYYSHTA